MRCARSSLRSLLFCLNTHELVSTRFVLRGCEVEFNSWASTVNEKTSLCTYIHMSQKRKKVVVSVEKKLAAIRRLDRGEIIRNVGSFRVFFIYSVLSEFSLIRGTPSPHYLG